MPRKIVFCGGGGEQFLEEGALWPLSATVRTVLSERFPTVRAVGIIAPTGPALVQAWQACLDEGRKPLILHYPTAKLSRIYWQETISRSIQSLSLDLLICVDLDCTPEIDGIPCLLLDELRPARSSRLNNSLRAVINHFRRAEVAGLNSWRNGIILQMSSGTTGYRKGM